MSTPDEVVQSQLAAQAADIASQAPAVPPIDTSAATATNLSEDQLKALLAIAEAHAAAEAAKPAPEAPASLLRQAQESGAGPSFIQHLAATVDKILEHLGIEL